MEAEALTHILLRLPCGTAAGLSGWTYKHVRAAGLYDTRTGKAMRRFVNDILSGAMLHLDLLLASRLIALKRPQGGVPNRHRGGVPESCQHMRTVNCAGRRRNQIS